MQDKVINTLELDLSEICARLGSTYAKYGKANSPCGLTTGWKYSLIILEFGQGHPRLENKV